MPRLTIEGMHDSQKIVEGTHTPALLCVTVTDDDGKPVDGLKAANFKLIVIRAPTIGGEWGDSHGPIEIASANPFQSGYYVVGVKSGLALAWGAGHYVVGLTVERKYLVGGGGGVVGRPATDNGQTIVSFDVKFA
jgi:hypothetical protein